MRDEPSQIDLSEPPPRASRAAPRRILFLATAVVILGLVAYAALGWTIEILA